MQPSMAVVVRIEIALDIFSNQSDTYSIIKNNTRQQKRVTESDNHCKARS